MTDDIFKYIDVERTIAEFGYDPRELKQGSGKKTFCFCKNCLADKGALPFNRISKSPTLCKECQYSLQIGRKHSEATKLKMVKNKKKEYISPENEKVFNHIDLELTINSLNYEDKFSIVAKSAVYAICYNCKEKRLTNFNSLKLSCFKTGDKPKCKACASLETKTKDKPSIELSLLKNVKIEKTIEVFGHDPRLLTRRSNKKVIAFCPCCYQEKIVPLQSIGDSRELCRSCATKRRNIKAFSVKECKGCEKEFYLYQSCNYCPDCSKKNSEDWLIKWKEKNPEKSSEYSKRYKEKHPWKHKRYYEANKPEIRTKQRFFYRQAAMNRAIAIVTSNSIEE